MVANDDDHNGDEDDCGGDGDGGGGRGKRMMADTRGFLETLQQWHTTATWLRWRSHGMS